MAAAYFQADTVVYIDGVEHVMLRKVEDELWQLEVSSSKRIVEMTDAELRAQYVQRRLRFFAPRAANETVATTELGEKNAVVREKHFKDAKVRRAYAKAAVGLPATRILLQASVDKTWKALGSSGPMPHPSSVLRWRAALTNSGGDIHSLIVSECRRGNRTRRYPIETLEIVTKAVKTVYLTREKKTVQDVLEKALVEVRRANKLLPEAMPKLPEPSIKAVKRAVEQIPAFERCVAREGRQVAVARFRSMLRHRLTEAPLERAEIDHTLMDLMVIDDDSGLPLGRPTLTACIDDFSRNILGINIGFEPPNFLTVARCLKHAFLPKSALTEEFPEVRGKWIAHGVMRELSMDNGAEFHAVSLERGCLSLGIEIHYAPRKTPWFKGKIERHLPSPAAAAPRPKATLIKPLFCAEQ